MAVVICEWNKLNLSSQVFARFNRVQFIALRLENRACLLAGLQSRLWILVDCSLVGWTPEGCKRTLE